MIPFIDLKAQQARIRPALDKRFSDILNHGAYIMGPEVSEIETILSDYCGSKHTLSCSNGTDALILALMVKGIQAGDVVIVPAYTFVATAEAVAVLGAIPFFVDVDPHTFNMCPQSLDEGIRAARAQNLPLRGIITVGLFGQTADMDPLTQIAHAHDLWVLDDAAQDFGATYKGRVAGNLGDISTTSFFPAKPMGCYGDGGAVFTNSDAEFEILKSMRVHGQGTDKYDNVRLGMTGRLDTLQAAVLLEKMPLFDEEIDMRQVVAARYTQGLEGLCETPFVLDECVSTWAQYTIKVAPTQRATIVSDLKEAGIPSMIYYAIPLHLQKAYCHYPRARESLATSEMLSQQCMSLPMHPYLEATQQDAIINEFSKIVEKSAKAA